MIYKKVPFQKKALYAGSEKLFKIQTDEQKQTFPCFFQVSWLKRHGDTPHLLTFGLTTYSNDARIQVCSCFRRMREHIVPKARIGGSLVCPRGATYIRAMQ